MQEADKRVPGVPQDEGVPEAVEKPGPGVESEDQRPLAEKYLELVLQLAATQHQLAAARYFT